MKKSMGLVLVFCCMSACATPQGSQGSETKNALEKKPEGTALEQQDAVARDPGIKQGGVKADLEAFLAGKGDPGHLSISYDALHELHGGIRLSVAGTGAIAQEAKFPGGASAGTPKQQVSAADLRALVQLLLDLEAWEQRIAERPLLADESTVKLNINTASGASSIWEFYNDMKQVQRIERIRVLLFEISWQQ
ncbi:MAG: hypothetical protein QNJ97_12405 [Myxococcota bacterium]|nr:hypothetical protein [Myxococcota bacterium]